MNDSISRQAAIDAFAPYAEYESNRTNAEWVRRINMVLSALPSAQPECADCVKNSGDYECDHVHCHKGRAAQPGQRNARVFQGIIVEYPSISAYPEYEGKPYFSIKYTENGQEFIGYGTYKPEVLSEYLKEYFMPPTQPECEDAVSREAVLNEIHRYMEERDYTIGLLDDNVCGLPSVTPKQPGWIPTSVKPPEPFKLVLIQDSCGCYELNTYIPPRINPKQYPNGYWGEVGTVYFDYFDVEAWCPLPAPYREGGQDG